MDEVYAIGMRLVLDGTIKQDVTGLVGLFRDLLDGVTAAQKLADKLAGSVGKLRDASAGVAKAWADVASAMERAARASGGVAPPARPAGFSPPYRPNFTMPGYVAPTPRGSYPLPAVQQAGGGFTFPGALTVPGREGPIPLYPNGYAGPGGIGRGLFPNGLPSGPILQGGLGEAALLGIPAYAGGSLLESMFGDTAAFDSTKRRLAGMGFSDAQVGQASAAAYATQQQVAGSSVQGNLALVADLMKVTQDAGASIRLLQPFATLGVQLQAFGRGGEAGELLAAIRSGEFRGVLTGTDGKLDTGRLQAFLNEAAASSAISGGDFGPTQLLKFLRASGSAGAMLDDQALFAKILAQQIALGSSRAGTALQGFEQQFSAGRMSKATFHLLQNLGIFSGDPATFERAGLGQIHLKAGALPTDQALQVARDPTAFILDHILPAIQGAAARDYGTTYTKGSAADRALLENKEAATLASRIPGATELAETLRNVLLIGRDVAAYQAQLRTGDYAKAAQNNPQIQQAALDASYHALLTSFGDTAMPAAIAAMNGITGFLNSIADWARKNPDQANTMLTGFATAIGLFAAGSAASLGLTLLTSKVTGLAALAAGIGALAAAVGGVPKWLVDMGIGAAVGGRVAGAPGAVVGGLAGAAIGGDASGRPSADGLTPMDRYILQNHLGTVPPPPSPQSGGPKGTANDPVHMTGTVNVGNGRDLVNGVAGGIAQQASRPQATSTPPDVRIDPGLAAAYGGGN